MPRGKRAAPPRRKSYDDWLLLQTSAVRRVANYIDDVGELIGAGSTQPREWLERYSLLWNGLLDDVGDWLQRESGNPVRPSTDWLRRKRIELQQRLRTASIPFDVPLEAFPEQRDSRKPITLKIGGLVRDGKGELLDAKQHLRFGGRVRGGKDQSLIAAQNLKFDDSRVWIDDRRRRLKVCDLPPLRVGDVYSGIVWAEETKCPVVAIEVAIV